MIFAMLRGDLPPRGLDGITERSTVAEAKRALLTAYKEDPSRGCRLSVGGSELSDDASELAQYGIEPDALIDAEWVGEDGRAEAAFRL